LDNNSVVRRDSLSQRDRVDYFKFSLNKRVNAKFKLAGLRANADLALLDGAGKVVARSTKGNSLFAKGVKNLIRADGSNLLVLQNFEAD
jgi:hypothetical protein